MLAFAAAIDRLRRSGRGAAASPEKIEPHTDSPSFMHGVAHAHPAADAGIPALGIDDLLAPHQALIGRIKLCYGADRHTFESELLEPIKGLAQFVNQLPATADNYFAGAGGLLRLGLEVAFFSLQGTDGHIVSGKSPISTRRQLEPRWRRATFLAGLCSELHRTLSALVVTDAAGEEWPAYLGPLTPWLRTRRADRFFVRWIANAQEVRPLGLFALPHIVPGSVLQELARYNTTVVPHLLACISGTTFYRDHNILNELVRRSAALVMDRDLVASSHRYGRPILGAHLERYLLDAMRQLLEMNPSWVPNQERSRVWFAEDGLFIVWPDSVADIRKLLEEAQLPGIPKSPETIAELLGAAGALQQTESGGYLWSIQPWEGKSAIEAVRLSSPDILLAPLAERPTPLPKIASARRAASADKPAAEAAAAAADLAQGCHEHTTAVEDAAVGDADAQQSLFDEEAAVHASTPSRTARSKPPRGAEEPPVELPTVAPGSAMPDASPFPVTASPLVFRLRAPMRLSPSVRDALGEIVSTLNGDAKHAAACTVSAGVFVPISELTARKVDAALALRAIAEVGIGVGVQKGRVRTVEHDFGGRSELGFILSPLVVEGLNPADFRPVP